jgi:hypothetical protein
MSLLRVRQLHSELENEYKRLNLQDLEEADKFSRESHPVRRFLDAEFTLQRYITMLNEYATAWTDLAAEDNELDAIDGVEGDARKTWNGIKRNKNFKTNARHWEDSTCQGNLLRLLLPSTFALVCLKMDNKDLNNITAYRSAGKTAEILNTSFGKLPIPYAFKGWTGNVLGLEEASRLWSHFKGNRYYLCSTLDMLTWDRFALPSFK